MCVSFNFSSYCSHIDTAWLWPYAETRRKIARSWATQLLLIDQYHESVGYKFGASQAVQYAWLKEDYPSLFARVKQAVKRGTFLPLGGTWVEMDCNIPSGESFCRQFLQGQRFFKKEFGAYCDEFWLPDTFGYSAQLPQIVRHSGIRYFLTQKLSWNLINKFPHHSFYWEGLDGSTVLTHFPPADTYNSRVSVEEVLKSVSNFKDLERSDDAMLLLGHGDGGGGAQAEMLERMARMKDLRGLPRVVSMAPVDFFKRMEQRAKPLLKWSGELYFELHRGTYTTHAQVKRGNRRCELLLREVELWAAAGPLEEYPHQDLERLWRLVLLNQFHDVLPGSSITDVYTDCHQHHEQVLREAHALLLTAMANFEQAHAPSKKAKGDDGVPARGHRVYNSLPWERVEVVTLPDNSVELAHVPAMAAGLVSAADTRALLRATPSQNRIHKRDHSVVLENSHLVATFDTRTGRLTSLLHKATQREAIQGEANAFVIFDDVNLFWDAWDTEVFHLEKKKGAGSAVSVSVVQDTPLRSAIKITMTLSPRSTLDQVVSLDHLSPRLDFATHVVWNENRRFLKVEFATAVRSPYGQATFETQFGHLQRPTHRNTSWDVARFEVCGHKWADISSYGFGVALLNDCKYGYAVEDNVIRLSLIRSPKGMVFVSVSFASPLTSCCTQQTAPDPECDIGEHTFIYSLMPHAGSLQEGGVIQQGYNLNVPLIVSPTTHATSSVPSLFTVEQQPHNQVILETVKRAEDDHNAVVLRLYESFGGTQRFLLRSQRAFTKVQVVNVLEEPMMDGDNNNTYNLTFDAKSRTISATLTSFQLVSLKLWL